MIFCGNAKGLTSARIPTTIVASAGTVPRRSPFGFGSFFLREWLDAFRTVNWKEIQRDLNFSGLGFIVSNSLVIT